MEIPLFPLRTVLCPGIALPLHVFEPRYKLMTQRCVEGLQPFGIVLIREGREAGPGNVSIAGVGTLAEIRESTRYPDGRYDLLVVGVGRFAIEAVDAEREPYLLGKVVPIDDQVGDADRAAALAARSMRRFVAYLQLLQPMEGETAEEIDVRVEIETEVEEGEQPPQAPPESEPETRGSSAVAEPEATIPTEPAASTEDAADPSDPEEAERAAKLDEAVRRLVIPDDPTTLSYLLSGIIQVDPARRQHLLEAATTEQRLELLDALIDRELWMLRRRLRFYAPADRQAAVRRN
ncbi:MAG TPA: LON peptidase substrate-binding domain-containing protein [Candidatus Limnocylindrales bacterium]|jgi:Lon protease-like protein|nr:LON peptidase substrate-binding domain-containing protein [Candidatus Limnocylindrales bacterium]